MALITKLAPALWLALVCSLTASCAGTQQPPLPAIEFRAAWIATVVNIDWPSRPGLPTATAKAELAAIVERAADLRLNALVFQVRPCGDAFYASKYEPWSEWLTGAQGRPPEAAWDPLQFLIEQAHPRGIEVHAWFNPFRARHEKASTPEDPRHVLRQMPSLGVRYGSQIWMDPGDPRAIDWTLRVIDDVVERYDVDGIHLDDYFYPYPVKKQPFPDDRTYQRYQLAGGELPRDDWRRSNVDTFLRRLYADAHAAKPFLKVGISPFGIARPGMPRGIQAGIDQYQDLGADVLGWLKRGLCDYLSPQLYWPIDQKAQSFAVLLPWWCAQNGQRRHLWPGLSASRAQDGKAPWRTDEIPQQIEAVRSQGPAPGHVLYSFQALAGRIGDQVRAANRELALPPACPWLPGTAPSAPTARLERAEGSIRLRWRDQPEARTYVIQVVRNRRWQTFAIRGRGQEMVPLPADVTMVAVRGVAGNGLIGPPQTLSLTP